MSKSKVFAIAAASMFFGMIIGMHIYVFKDDIVRFAEDYENAKQAIINGSAKDM